MGIEDRLADAEALWSLGRTEGAFLLALVALAALAKQKHPKLSDREGFEEVMHEIEPWNGCVEYRGRAVDVATLFYKHLRCSLVHEGEIPPDIRIDSTFTEADGVGLRAGGAPEYRVLLTPGWFHLVLTGVRRHLRETPELNV